ncbi:terminase [Salmonella enterica subsp. enterica serovar Senftenberg]|nr:terminase [Salmonella enterica subsp. enterica serovar Senftenberg]EDT7030196.1 terminase [Salmonella enterica subsp. enterica serovar Worthington]MBE0063426.1 terminase [Citrobacter freundii]MCA2402954.1 terminase [Enterobacter sp. CCUG 70166]POU22568.1 terminase [Citrobacter freundii complex sp. CFNIH8]QBI27867.1 terminase [Citrobacter sp. ABFQG]TSD19570.1 terminase [Enterobacter hormaechei]GCS29022.1 phage terminase small subunit [Escherichia coli]
MLSQPLTGRMDGVGEVFRTNPSQRGTTRPLKFLRTVIFLKIKRDGNEKFLWQDHQNRQLTLMS